MVDLRGPDASYNDAEARAAQVYVIQAGNARARCRGLDKSCHTPYILRELSFREGAMLTAEENDLLCRVEGPSAMGRLMRQHWLPACMSEEVVERDGTPV